jgi:hypothetical protein
VRNVDDAHDAEQQAQAQADHGIDETEQNAVGEEL